MMDRHNFLNDPEFVNTLAKKANEILKQSRNTIMDIPEYKILCSQYLYKFWSKRSNKSQMFIIYIHEEEIKNLNIKQISKNLNATVMERLKSNNEILVNNKFEVLKSEYIKYSNTREAYKAYKDKSSNEYCVFFFGSKGVETFIKGESEDLNIFYCEEDLLRYSEKKHISEIKDVLSTYQNRWLTQQCEYSLFFESNYNIERIGSKYKNLLRNKPEKLMRDHLRKFLNDHMQHTFVIETELASSKKKLDISTEVDGKFYFFEIKWLGKSINECGTKIGTTYSDSRARDGVKQTLEYIDELIVDMNINVKCGYLVVFDARDKQNEIQYKNYEFIDKNLCRYLDNFDVIDYLRIENRHPA
ncbi:hypothetical protein ACOAKC_09340 [Hathewaya histolytica]|uniref:hypothetical protein n=1 Tax=Hathewaya histolytica TaxID=1498 RepID=UPI003B67B928